MKKWLWYLFLFVGIFVDFIFNGCSRRISAHHVPFIDAAGYHRGALALPAGFFHGDDGGHNNPFTRETFLREYRWIKTLLERSYPGHEFLFIPQKWHKQHPGHGWIEVEFRWRGHLIYRRPISGESLLNGAA
jgi:hypothetical protein